MHGSYPISTTEAYIIHTKGVHEADRILTALTKDKGMLEIYARGIRKEGAKMRNRIKPYAHTYLSVIHGKTLILKDAAAGEPLDTIWENKKKYTALVKLFKHTQTLIPVNSEDSEQLFLTIKKAIEAHVSWVNVLENMAKTNTLQPIQTNDHKCGFGHFYYGVKPTNPRITNLWSSVEEVHSRLHRKADSIIDIINKGSGKNDAIKVLDEANNLSEKIIGIFSNMISIAEKMNENDEKVF